MRQSLRRPWTVQGFLVPTTVFLLVALVAPAQAAPVRSQNLSPGDAPSVLLRDGVLLDLSRDVAYVMNRSGGIAALRTTDGALLWRTDEAAKPLLVTDELIVAQAEASAPGGLAIVSLEREHGRVVATGRIDLPPDVWATVSDRPRAAFRAAARPAAGGVDVVWQSSQTGAEEYQGYVPSPDEGRAPGEAELAVRAERQWTPRLRHGAATFDPRTGAVRATGAKAGPAAGVHAAALKAFEGLRAIEGRRFLSADGRHVLASRTVGPPGTLDRYQWSIYTRTGDLLGSLRSHRAATPFVVSGSLVLFENGPYVVRRGEDVVSQRLQVLAVDLATGAKAWETSVRETEFAGPFPP